MSLSQAPNTHFGIDKLIIYCVNQQKFIDNFYLPQRYNGEQDTWDFFIRDLQSNGGKNPSDANYYMVKQRLLGKTPRLSISKGVV